MTILVGDQSKGIEMCPLGCGSRWHGLPKEATHRTTACPSVWGVPVSMVELDEEDVA